MSEQDVFDQLKYRIEAAKDGTRRYYNRSGQLHRTDGPAIEDADGSAEWYQNGRLHRTDGPAIKWDDNDEWWCINGVQLSEAEFNQRVKK